MLSPIRTPIGPKETKNYSIFQFLIFIYFGFKNHVLNTKGVHSHPKKKKKKKF